MNKDRKGRLKKEKGLGRRLFALLMSLCLVAGSVNLTAFAADSATNSNNAYTTVADADTTGSYRSMLGTANDGTRYAGRVWVDKSVFTGDYTGTLPEEVDGKSSYTVENNSDFLVAFSALGSSYTVTGQAALDVVILLDNSQSMSNSVTVNGSSTSRMAAVTSAANTLLQDIVGNGNNNNRVSIVTYNSEARTLLPLDSYSAATLTLASSGSNNQGPGGNSGGSGVLTASATKKSNNSSVTGSSNGYQSYTNLQVGLNRVAAILGAQDSTEVANRIPVVIVLADGVADGAASNWTTATDTAPNAQQPGAHTLTAGVAMSTLFTAANMKAVIEDTYTNKDALILSVGVDIDDGDAAVVMDPKTAFADNSTSTIGKNTYAIYEAWLEKEEEGTTHIYSESVSSNNGGGNRPGQGSSSTTYSWSFPHITTGDVVDADLKENIKYVDEYYEVTSETLGDTFSEIYEYISSPAFNPITDSGINEAGIEMNTPLAYVDFIGDYMEVKGNTMTLMLYGKEYTLTAGTSYLGAPENPAQFSTGVLAQSDYVTKTEYAAAENTMIKHPVLNVEFDLNQMIKVVLEEHSEGADKQQKLWIYGYEEVLPIELTKIKTGENEYDIDEYSTNHGTIDALPLRIFYEVGLADEIVTTDENGKKTVDFSQVSEEYITNNTVDGEVKFYANQYGKENTAAEDGTLKGDAHASFTPSDENRYYYHQENYKIFDKIYTSEAMTELVSDDVLNAYDIGLPMYHNGEYIGYKGDNLTYAELKAGWDEDQRLYAVVAYYKDATAEDSGNFMAYYAYTTWKELQDATAYYDEVNGVYINLPTTDGESYSTSSVGAAIPWAQASTVLDAYISATGILASDITTRLGVGSERIQRLENMTQTKAANTTDTATLSYAPEYNDNIGDHGHVGTILVWLGNNGVLSVAGPEPATGTLEISKTVTADEGLTAPSDKEFTFKVDFTEPTGSTKTSYAYTIVNAEGTEVSSGSIASGGSITLKDGQKAIFEELTPDTTYKVTETSAVAGFAAVDAELDGTITSGETSVAAFTNNYAAGAVSVTFEGAKTLTGKTWDDDEFSIILESTNLEAPMPTKEGVTVTRTTTFQSAEIIVKASGTDSNGTGATTNAYDFGSIEFTKAGEYEYTISERIPTNPGAIDYSAAIYRVVVTVTDNGEGQLIATAVMTKIVDAEGDAVTGTDAEIDSATSTATDTAIEVGLAVFYNAYEVGTTNWTPVGTKVYTDNSGINPMTDGKFEFTMTAVGKKTDNGIEETIDIPMPAGAVNGSITFENVGTEILFHTITYTTADVGQYVYRFTEVASGEDGMTYDEHEYDVTVTVTVAQVADPDGQGGLVDEVDVTVDYPANTQAFPNGNESRLVFYNTYNLPAAAQAKATIDGSKSLSGRNIKDGEFTFKIEAVTDGAPMPSSTTVQNSGNGFAFGEITHTTAGTYVYRVTEVVPAENPYKGVTYDTHSETVTVVVAEDPDNPGTLKAEVYKDSDGVAFANTYETTFAGPMVNLTGTKNLTGQTLELDEFYFDVYQKVGNEWKFMKTASNEAGALKDGAYLGNINLLSGIAYKEAGVYYYLIHEVLHTENGTVVNPYKGVTYDTTYYLYEVTVKDDGEGNLYVVQYDDATGKLYTADSDGTIRDEASAVVFNNTYVADVPEVVAFPTLHKSLTGKTLTAGAFEFKMEVVSAEPSDGIVLPTDTTVANAADGKISFGDITFTKPGTYQVKVSEVQPTGEDVTTSEDGRLVKDGVAYSKHEYSITYLVTDNFDGTLSVETVGVPADTTFINTYVAEATPITITGVKVLNGAELVADQFEFALYETDEDYVIDDEATLVNNATVKNDEDGIFAITVDYESDGIHYYVLKEVAGNAEYIKYDETEYQIKVVVTDDGVGNLVAVEEYQNATDYGLVFTNEIIDDVTDKEVFKSDDAETNIDGWKVEANDVLTYVITYRNYTGKTANVVIKDKIPEYTTYVEGSASGNATYNESTRELVWQIEDVAPLGSVEVSFSVKVNENVGNQDIPNQAEVNDGTNTYYTEEVFNYTYDAKKDVFAEDDLTTSINGQKVATGDILTYTIEYANTTDKDLEITITDEIPEYTEYVEDSADHDGVYADGVVTWTMTVPRGKSVTVSFQVEVTSVAQDIGVVVVNEATVVIGTDNPETITTNQVENEIEAADANVTLEKWQSLNAATNDSADIVQDLLKVQAGDVVTYYLKATNAEDAGTAYDVVIKDAIPDGLVLESISADGVENDGVITWTIDSLEAGESVTVSFNVIVPEVDEDTTWTNVATVFYENPDETFPKDPTPSNEVEIKVEVPEVPEEPEVIDKNEEDKTEVETPEPDDKDSVQTGDMSSPVMWTSLAFGSLMVCAILLINEKKKNA